MQGRDRDLLFFSCVRANRLSQCGDLLCEWRRVNVALTRPKQKLIILGSVRTISNAPPFQGVLNLVSNEVFKFTFFNIHHRFFNALQNSKTHLILTLNLICVLVMLTKF